LKFNAQLKKNLHIGISVIIPTIGRQSLINAVSSACDQTYPVSEIIIVGECSTDLQAKLREKNKTKVPILYIHETKRKVSARRNLGILKAKGEYVAFLDDDDFWHPNKIEIQLMQIPAEIISSRAEYIGWHPGIRPQKIIEGKILATIYSRFRVGSKLYGLPTPTLLVNRDFAAKILFDEEMSEWEDLWFLHNLEGIGARIVQVPETLVVIRNKKPLSNRNITTTQYLDWYKKLSRVNTCTALNFILFVAFRNLIFRRRWKSLFFLSYDLISHLFRLIGRTR
jgi:glycosyltransferase involved in cell wall biosynthesis